MTYEWMGEALCAQTDPALFFPEVGGNGTVAKRICADCPVRIQCETHAQHLEGGSSEQFRFGSWGGRSPKERALVGGERRAARRDRDAVRLDHRGLTPAEIAERLGCSERTVNRALATARRTETAA